MTTTLTSPAGTTGTRTIEAVDRVSVRDSVAHTFTMAYRGILKIKHNPQQLVDVVLVPIVFTAMFTYIFGGAISGDVQSYLPIIIPGILVQTVITTSIVTGTQLRDDMDKGVFDRFKSLPIARIAPLSGALLADVVRYLIATTITIVVGLAMGYRPDGGFVGVVSAALLIMLCAFAISWIFALMGVLMSSAAAVQGISMLILFPLTFMSNAFVPADTMPGWVQAFVNINPVSLLVTAVRELANDGHFGINTVWALVGAAVIVGIMAPLTVRTFMRKA
ncbi:ABC transporter permease [Rhodococcus xishaensis]|uniref:Transport permease protein n=1 Tax=Rhodococcus xishaensis TaxID=2487364 RepID=A0A3S3ACA7_9NOCA|nr:ABC transporter permease [Rhodococcus xishaensis]RVW01149.1 ABC transporter permease [Rhodococcus xishaensis]